MMFARIWLFCLAVTLGGCTHDAPALFGPATEDSLTPNERLRLPLARAARDVENAQPRYINRAAIDSNVIIVEIEGKKHRFVGALTSAKPLDHWSGQSSSGGRAEITRTSDSMSGQIDVEGRRFQFGGAGQYVIFFERNLNPPPLTAAERATEEQHILEAQRLSRAARGMPPLLAPDEKPASLIVGPADLSEFSAAEQARIAKLREDKNVSLFVPVRIDESALQSPVVLVFIEGRPPYLFRGRRLQPDKFIKSGWTGATAEGVSIFVSTDTDGFLAGRIDGGPKRWLTFGGKPPFVVITERMRDQAK